MSRRFANVLKADGLRARRSRRGVPVAIAGIADRASRGVSFRPRLGAAVHAVRRGCAGIPAREFRRESRRHRRGRLGEASQNPRPAAGSEGHLRHRRAHPRRREIVLGERSRRRSERFRHRRHLGRRSRHHHLHLGHDRKSERRAARASRAARPSAQRRDGARLLPEARRRDVDAGRLGVDRRAVRCAVSGAGITACRWSVIAPGNSIRRRRCN